MAKHFESEAQPLLAEATNAVNYVVERAGKMSSSTSTTTQVDRDDGARDGPSSVGEYKEGLSIVRARLKSIFPALAIGVSNNLSSLELYLLTTHGRFSSPLGTRRSSFPVMDASEATWMNWARYHG